MTYTEILQSLSTPLLTMLIASEDSFQTLNDKDQQFIAFAGEELANRKWPETLSDEEVLAALDTVPMGMPLHMVLTEAHERGLKTDQEGWTGQIVHLTTE